MAIHLRLRPQAFHPKAGRFIAGATKEHHEIQWKSSNSLKEMAFSRKEVAQLFAQLLCGQ